MGIRPCCKLCRPPPPNAAPNTKALYWPTAVATGGIASAECVPRNIFRSYFTWHALCSSSALLLCNGLSDSKAAMIPAAKGPFIFPMPIPLPRWPCLKKRPVNPGSVYWMNTSTKPLHINIKIGWPNLLSPTSPGAIGWNRKLCAYRSQTLVPCIRCDDRRGGCQYYHCRLLPFLYRMS